MKFDFVSIGGYVEDITLYTDKSVLVDNKKDILAQKLLGFEYGAKIIIEKHESFFGGGATNVAVALSRLGFSVSALINIGKDERGQKAIENFISQKVNVDLIKKTDKVPTGFSIIVISKNKEHVAFTVRGANSFLNINFLEKKTLAASSWIYLASLSGVWEEVLKKIFLVRGPKIAWNPGGTQLAAGAGKLRKFFKKTTILLVNKDEAIELIISDRKYKNKTNKFLNNKRNLLIALKSFGPEVVVMTDERRGADAYDGTFFYHQDSVANQAKIADTTGVGDAFCATFAAGYEKYNKDVKKAMKLAMKNAASVLRVAGAQNGLIKKKL